MPPHLAAMIARYADATEEDHPDAYRKPAAVILAVTLHAGSEKLGQLVAAELADRASRRAGFTCSSAEHAARRMRIFGSNSAN